MRPGAFIGDGVVPQGRYGVLVGIRIGEAMFSRTLPLTGIIIGQSSLQGGAFVFSGSVPSL
jgi:hypothetical protein